MTGLLLTVTSFARKPVAKEFGLVLVHDAIRHDALAEADERVDLSLGRLPAAETSRRDRRSQCRPSLPVTVGGEVYAVGGAECQAALLTLPQAQPSA